MMPVYTVICVRLSWKLVCDLFRQKHKRNPKTVHRHQHHCVYAKAQFIGWSIHKLMFGLSGKRFSCFRSFNGTRFVWTIILLLFSIACFNLHEFFLLFCKKSGIAMTVGRGNLFEKFNGFKKQSNEVLCLCQAFQEC